MKRLLLLLVIFAISNLSFGVTVYTIPGTSYATISEAITALNLPGGVPAGGVTFNIAAGYTESIAAALAITATGTVGDQIIFQKDPATSGANPLITRTDGGTLNTTAFGGNGDAIISLAGTDYITFNGIDLTAINSGIEYGFLTRKPSGTNGCKYVIIKNSVITMTKETQKTVIGIYIGNGTTSLASGTGVNVTALSGINSNIEISGNTIQNVHAGIYVRGSSAPNFKDSDITIGNSVAGNTIQNFGGGSATSSYGVYFFNVNNPTVAYNKIDNAGGGGAAHIFTLTGVLCQQITGNVNVSNNEFILANNSASSATFGINNQMLVSSENYSNNTFAGTISSTGTVGLIWVSNETPVKTISNNSISGTFSRTGDGGNFYCYYNNFGFATAGTETLLNNNFSNITLAGSSAFYGFFSTTSQSRICSGNTVSNITVGYGNTYGFDLTNSIPNQINNNAVSDITAQGAVVGINFGGATATVYQNDVKNLTTTGASMHGIINGGSTLVNCYKNNIVNLTVNNANPSLYGLYIASGDANYNYNNYICGLKTPSADAGIPLAGIYVSGGTTVGVYYNTVYLDAISSGTLFGSAALYASTTPTLDMRNNILVNISTPNGVGVSAAFRRSDVVVGLPSYSSSSNGNAFYAGATEDATHAVYYDGTNPYAIAAYTALVIPRDDASFRELPPFINVAPGLYNLHIATTIATNCESGGFTITAPIAIIDDFDGNTRAGNPDVGADEFAGIGATVTPPTAFAVTGGGSYCAGAGGLPIGLAGSELGVTYTLSPGGAVQAGTGAAISFGNQLAGAYTVSGTNAGGTTPMTGNAVITETILPVPVITGANSVCAGSTGIIYSTQAGMTNYVWSVSANGSITSGGTATDNTVTVSWSTAGAQSVSVNYTNATNCTAPSQVSYNVVVNAITQPVISGASTVSLGSTETYTTEAGMTNYSWIVSTGGSIVAGGTLTSNTITIQWNGVGNQSVSVNHTSSSGCTSPAPTVLQINVLSSLPPAAGNISGVSEVCQGASGIVYSIAAIPNATGYVWNLPAGAIITAGNNTNSITVNYSLSATSGIISVYGTNTFGNGNPSPDFVVNVNQLPVPVITGLSTVCVSASATAYSTQAGNTNYTWTVSSGGTITSGIGTNSITVIWSTPGANSVTVNYTNPSGCSGTNPATFNVNVQSVPVPSIQGTVEVCAGITGIIYSTQAGMTNYVWSVSAGGSITSGGTATDNTVTVIWNTAGSQSVNVNYANSNGCSAVSPVSYPVVVMALPLPTISGANVACESSAYLDYSTEPGMSNYVWDMTPNSGTITQSNTNVTSIFWTSAGARWVSVTYTNANGCSASAATVYNVTVNPLPGTPGNISGQSTVCAGSNAVAYSVTAVSNATTYVWTLPAGASIATGAGTNSITVNYSANATSGDVSVLAQNSCGDGVSSTLAVSVNTLPVAAGEIMGESALCQGSTAATYSVAAISGATTYNWTVPAGATIASGANTNSITVDFSLAATSGNVTVSGSNSCGTGTPSTMAVSVNTKPATPVITQNGNVLTSSSSTGNQWYKDGIVITGAASQTYTITGDGTYTVVVTLNGCSSDVSNSIMVIYTSIADPDAQLVSVYPNPTSGAFWLLINTPGPAVYKMEILNSFGAVVYKANQLEVNGTFKQYFDLHELAAGIYTLVLHSDSQQITKKIVIN